MRKLRLKDLKNPKAVSPVIAVLLMIAIAVAAAILVYVWSMGLIGTLQAGGGEQTAEQCVMEAYDWSTSGTLVLYLKNVGTASITVDSIYVAGSQEWTGTQELLVAAAGGTPATPVSVTTTGTFQPGVAYTIKVVTITGGIFTYSCVAGGAA